MYRFIQREIVLLLLVGIITVPAYLFTRTFAAQNREIQIQSAARWYQEGQQHLQAGEIPEAIHSFYRARTDDTQNFQYAFGLATALAAGQQDQEARRVLLGLRDERPENSQINLQLARLAARQVQNQEAARYYRNAIYGDWSVAEAGPERRQARVELIRFFLDHQDHGSALSELLLLSEELPSDAASYLQAARLFLEAGDPQYAMEHFVQAMEMDKQSATAAAGAGEAAFLQADYTRALRFFRTAEARGEVDERASELLEISRQVLANDPLGPRLAASERRRRLLSGWEHNLTRLQSCLEQQALPLHPDFASLDALQAEALALQPGLPRNLRRDPDQLPSVLDLVYRIARATRNACGAPEPLDQAWLLIGRKHAEEEP